MKNIENLFVYGTLQKGKQHQSILGKIKGKWKKGYVKGKLYNISSGPDYGYPGLKLNPKGLKIYGMIFQSKDLENYIKKIENIYNKSLKSKLSEQDIKTLKETEKRFEEFIENEQASKIIREIKRKI